MKRAISSSQKDLRLIHLTIDPVGLVAGGEDAHLVESVTVNLDEVTVKLKNKAKARGGRALGIAGLAKITGGENYSFTGSNTEDVVLTTENTGVHGDFALVILANDFRHIYEA